MNTKLSIAEQIDIWKLCNLEQMKRDLDEKIIEMAHNLEEGDLSRKQLIEQSKEFKKNLTDEQRKLVAPIVKLFQNEVDGSSKRCRMLEQVLLSLYKQIIDLPDPLECLDNCERLQKKAWRSQDLEIENKKLRETLDEYNSEFAHVKNQEFTIKNLKEKIKEMEEKNEQSLNFKIKEKEKEIARLYTEKEERISNQQLELLKKLGDAEAKNITLQNSVQKLSDELFELRQSCEDQLNAKLTEIDLLMLDLDKMTERALAAERLSQHHAAELDEILNQQKKDISNQINEEKINYQTSMLEMELISKEKEITHLVDEIQKLQAKSSKQKDVFEVQRVELEEKLIERERACDYYETELKKRLDYDEIKKELTILKTFEQASSLSYDGFPIPNNAEAINVSEKPLEIILLEKNQKLNTDNMHLKNKLVDLQSKYDLISSEHSSLMKSNLDQKSLIIELEKDLLQLASKKKVILENKNSVVETIADINSPNNDENITNLTSPIIDTPDMSLFNIVSSQRERFRARVLELESQNVSNKQQIVFFTNEVDRLRSDNVKLYEKIKFLQSVERSTKQKLSDAEDISFDLNNEYTSEYEKRLDPFAKFNLIEKQKRYGQLKLHDKFTFSFSRFILSNAATRLIFSAYFLIIHLLIFLSSYHMASHTASFRDISAECAQSYRDHMAHVHGVNSFEMPTRP